MTKSTDTEPSVDPALAALINGVSRDPFAVLGPHADASDGSWVVRALHPAARSIEVRVARTGELRPMTLRHPAGLFEVRLAKEDAADYRLRIAYRANGDAEHRVEIDDPYRYGRVLTDYDLHLLGEGTHHRAFEKLGAHRITVGTTTGVHFAVWAPNADSRQRRRRLQRLGRPGPHDAAARALGDLGDLHARLAGRRAVQVRDPDEGRRVAEEDRSVRRRLRGAAAVGGDRARHLGLPVAGRGVDGRAARAGRPARPADGDLRSASRLVGARARGRQSVSHLRRAGAPARAVREGDGLHAHRAAAGHGAPVLGILGLPGARLLRADQPLRHAGRLQAVRRRLPPGRPRRDSRLGAGPLSRRTNTGSPASTARRSSSTPTRGRASIRTGAR